MHSDPLYGRRLFVGCPCVDFLKKKKTELQKKIFSRWSTNGGHLTHLNFPAFFERTRNLMEKEEGVDDVGRYGLYKLTNRF